MSEIRLQLVGQVAVLTLNAPERRNALTPEMARDLVKACDEIDASPGVGAVVVCGAGEGFCAGADRALLSEAAENPFAEHSYRNLGQIYGAFTRVGALEPPTVAAVCGTAVGAGVNLMLATDLRVVAEDARIFSGFLQLGLHPGGGHFALLGRLAGREAAAGAGLFGLEVSGSRAQALGLAWEATQRDRVEARAMEIAHGVAADPELARATARSLRLELGPPALTWPAALESERGLQGWSLQRSATQKEALP